jgi:hypothetical protein
MDDARVVRRFIVAAILRPAAALDHKSLVEARRNHPEHRLLYRFRTAVSVGRRRWRRAAEGGPGLVPDGSAAREAALDRAGEYEERTSIGFHLERLTKSVGALMLCEAALLNPSQHGRSAG